MFIKHPEKQLFSSFQPSISKENVLRHLLRLVWYIHHKLPGARLEALLEGIAPNNEVVYTLTVVYSVGGLVTPYKNMVETKN